jgi:hypothetical protein
MSNEDKLYEVDTFLAMCEDFMHGKDGDDATKCRKLINEVINELSKLHQPTVSNSVCVCKVEKRRQFEIDMNQCRYCEKNIRQTDC